MKKGKYLRCRGFTLVEMLVSLILVSLMIEPMGSLLRNATQNYLERQSVTQQAMQIQLFFQQLEQRLRAVPDDHYLAYLGSNCLQIQLTGHSGSGSKLYLAWRMVNDNNSYSLRTGLYIAAFDAGMAVNDISAANLPNTRFTEEITLTGLAPNGVNFRYVEEKERTTSEPLTTIDVTSNPLTALTDYDTIRRVRQIICTITTLRGTTYHHVIRLF